MDAMSGRGELGDRDLVADLYGLGGRTKCTIGRTGADGADDEILDGAARRTSGRGRAGRTGRRRADGAD